MNYVGRFAPSPTGPLHLGSLVSALASWLDAKAHQGTWIVRIEDIDSTRSHPHFSELILSQLKACGLYSDVPIVYQSQRESIYLSYLQELMPSKLLYPCQCSRQQIELAQTQATSHFTENSPSNPLPNQLIYPGTCRGRGRVQKIDYLESNQKTYPTVYAQEESVERSKFFQFYRNDSIRIQVPDQTIHWIDRRLGKQEQNLSREVGDFVLKSRDHHFSYQWAVVVDDIDQGVSDIVRGEDLADNTPRQLFLYDLLSSTKPRYLHIPLVTTSTGEKLSKQTHAPALDPSHALNDLNQAARHLGLTPASSPLNERLLQWVKQWADQQLITVSMGLK